MNKKITLSLTFIALITTSCIIRSEDGWYPGKYLIAILAALQKDADERYKKELELTNRITHIVHDQIDYMLATSEQPLALQREIQQKKGAIANEIIQHIRANYYYHSDAEIIAITKKLTKNALVQLIAADATTCARKEANRIYNNPYPPINPELIRQHHPTEIANKVTQHVLKHAQKAAQDPNYGSLSYYFGEQFESKVQEKVRKKFGLSEFHATHHPQIPSGPYYPPVQEYTPHQSTAPSLYPSLSEYKPQAPQPQPKPAPKPPIAQPKPSGDIHEIYPKLDDLERNKEFFGKVERKQIHRESDCCVCMESFKEIGKRVTLFCGHSICATCLFGMLHITNKAQCPLCRATIEKNEFSVDYLKAHVNVPELKDSLPNNLSDIKRYFSWA